MSDRERKEQLIELIAIAVIGVVMLFALTAKATAQPQAPIPPQAPSVRVVAPQSPKPPQAPPVVAEVLPRPKPTAITYADAHAQALRESKRLAVFVGTPARPIAGVVTVSVPWEGDFTRYPQRSLVVFGERAGLPKDLYKLGVVDPSTADDEIRSGGKAASPMASPFVPSPSPASETTARRDDPLPLPVGGDKGVWPASLPFPAGLVRYRPAQHTQEIAVTNDRDRITPVHRSRLEAKWQVPGGMAGVTGWKSDLYKYVPPEYVGPGVGVRNIPVWNGTNFQNNRGWVRAYPVGTFFVDVLSHQGEMFETRIREKKADGWESYVAAKNVEARPPGYTGLRQSCASCHSEAGSGGYATGLVPGGDTVLSDPFDALESGSPFTQETFDADVPFGSFGGMSSLRPGRRR